MSIDIRILDAAQSLLSELGEAFTMDQLEARANISRASIYRHVGNKQTILNRLAEERGQTFEKINIRQDILNAARTLFGRVGLASTTMEQIASQAGVGVATVYRHFGDKDSLVVAFFDEVTPRAKIYSLALNPTKDIAGDLEDIVRQSLRFFFENRDIFRLVFVGNEPERRYLEGLRKRSDSTLSNLTKYFQSQIDMGQIKDIGGASDLALALMGLILTFSIIGPVLYRTKFENPERISQVVLDIFINSMQRDK